MTTNLTEEQLRRIEENKKKALAKRAEKLTQSNSPQKTKPVFNRPKDNTSSNTINASSVPFSGVKSAQRNNAKSSGIQPLNYNGSGSNKVVGKSSTECVGPGDGFNKTHEYSVKSNIQNDNKPCNAGNVSGSLNSGTKIHVGIAPRTSLSSTISKPAVMSEKKELSVQERIEENRRKALEKRAEKQKLSPLKPASGASENNLDKVNSSHFISSSLNQGHKSGKNNVAVASSKISESVHANDMTSNFSSNTVKSSDSWTAKESINQQLSSVSHDRSGSGNMFKNFGMKPVKGSCVLISRDRFEVKVGFSAPLVQFFKTMDTKLYDAVTKKWSFKLSEYQWFMTALKGLGPSVDIEPLPNAILQAFSVQIKGETSHREIPIADLSKVEPTLVNSLMSFQRQGVNYGIWKNGRVLIADDMGLGKTIQAICLACYYRDEWPVLVVVPSSVRFDWAQQFQRWVPSLDPQQISVAVTGKDSCSSGLVNILSYDLMSKKGDMLRRIHFQVIIMDECHLLKNYKTARCKAAMPLLKNSKRVILLSGTPALSRPSELYTQICAVCPFLFKFQDFGVRYCDGKQQPWGWDFTGSSNMTELQLLLEEKVMIRRLKKDVLSELPDKVRQMVLLDPRSIKVDKDLKNASKVISSSKLKGMEQRGALLEFFHQSGKAKLAAVKTYVEDLLEGDRKFIIFAHHQEVLDGVETVVKDKIGSGYIRIDGRTNSEQRNYFCKKFQHNDNITVAILSITAANAGLNLSAATLVVFAELFWNPGILVQAEDRAHRIGQQDSVSVHYLVATGTSDDHIWPMIQKKLDVLGKAGLTKDDFSSADTTRVKDPRQEEIIRFLEESFSEDFDGADPIGCDADDGFHSSGSSSSELEPKRKTRTIKQASIQQFCSPLKELPQTSKTLPSNPPKPKGLLKYFSPEKKKVDTDTKLNDESEERHRLEVLKECDNDMDMFLNEDDDLFDEITEPQQKKQRT